jgi:hypothetical protein
VTSTRNGGEWSASNPIGVLETAFSIHCIGGWVRLRHNVNVMEKRTVCCSSRQSNLGHPARYMPPNRLNCLGPRDITTSAYKKLRGLSPRANYTDRATAACRRSDCQLFADRGCYVVIATDPYYRILGFLDRSRYFSTK